MMVAVPLAWAPLSSSRSTPPQLREIVKPTVELLAGFLRVLGFLPSW